MFGFDRMTSGLQSFADITSDDRAVQMIVGGSVSFDRRAVLADRVGNLLILLDACCFDGASFSLCFSTIRLF